MCCWKYINYVYEQSNKIPDFAFNWKVWENKNQVEYNNMTFKQQIKKWESHRKNEYCNELKNKFRDVNWRLFWENSFAMDGYEFKGEKSQKEANIFVVAFGYRILRFVT